MKTILDTLRNGNGRERLAVIADLFSIVGISGAAIVSSLWALDWPSKPEAILGPPTVALATLAGLSFALAITIFMVASLEEMFGKYRAFYIPLAIAVWCFFGIAALYAVGLAVHLIRTTQW